MDDISAAERFLEKAKILDSSLSETTELDALIEKKKENIKHNIVSGTCSDYNEYRYMVGFYEGLSESQNILRDLKKRYLSGEDLEEDAER